MATQGQVEELRARFAAMQSGGARVLSNASLALKALDALDVVDPPAPVPEPPPVAPTPRPPAGDLTRRAGGTISDDNLALTDVLIEGDVTFTGDNVTLHNVTVTGHTIFRGDGYEVTDSTFGSWVASGASNVTMRRIVSGGHPGKDAVHITANPTSAAGRSRNILIEDATLHATSEAINASTNHYDGVQIRGAVGVTLRRLDINHTGTPTSRDNGTIFVQDANGGSEDIVIDDCYLSSAGYYNARIHAPGVTITNTRFGRPIKHDGQTWNKPLLGSSDPVEQSGNTWADTGEPLTL